jgi:hypothetical protein
MLSPFNCQPIVPDGQQPEPPMKAVRSTHFGISMIASNAVREPYGELLQVFENRTFEPVLVSW